MTHWCITSTDLAHQTELNTRGHACSLVIVKNKAFEISARGVSGRWQWERDMQAVLTVGLFCWIGSGRTVSLFIPSFFSCSMVRPLLIYNHNPKKTERDWVGKKRVWGVMSKMLHSDVMLDYTVMVCLWSHVNVFSAFWNNLKAFHRAQRKTSTLRFKITNTHPHTISASFLIVSPNALSYNFTHLTNPFLALHHHKFSQILQHSFHSFQIKGKQPLAASITEWSPIVSSYWTSSGKLHFKSFLLTSICR